ncbi:hypothetical protein [Vibrio sp. HN007]|uniref:hypothetical protein n=1 Tax=Vibrio iocasae TaxID=3098914 RepID=UPI0035D48755
MSSVYKIEAQNEKYANMIKAFITSKNGKSIVQGSAVITDYHFSSNSSLWLLPLISTTHDDVTQNDIDSWVALGH